MPAFINNVIENLVFLATIITSVLALIIPMGLALVISGGVNVDDTYVNWSVPGRNSRADSVVCEEWAVNIEQHGTLAQAALWRHCIARGGWVFKNGEALL